MNLIRKHMFFKFISVLLIIAFLNLDLAWAYPSNSPNTQNLAVSTMFQKQIMVEGVEEFKDKAVALNSALNIGRYLLGDPSAGMRPLSKDFMETVLKRELGNDLAGIDISSVKINQKENIVLIPYSPPEKTPQEQSEKYVIQVALKNKVNKSKMIGVEYDLSKKYIVKLYYTGERPAFIAFNSMIGTELIELAESGRLSVSEYCKIYKNISSELVERRFQDLVKMKYLKLSDLQNGRKNYGLTFQGNGQIVVGIDYNLMDWIHEMKESPLERKRKITGNVLGPKILNLKEGYEDGNESYEIVFRTRLNEIFEVLFTRLQEELNFYDNAFNDQEGSLNDQYINELLNIMQRAIDQVKKLKFVLGKEEDTPPIYSKITEHIKTLSIPESIQGGIRQSLEKILATSFSREKTYVERPAGEKDIETISRSFLTIDDVNVEGKTCGVRIDINTKLTEGEVKADNRIRAAAITLKELLDKGAKVVSLAHQDRPGGKHYLEFMDKHAKVLQEEMQRIENAEAKAQRRKAKNYEVLTIENDDLFGPIAQDAIKKYKKQANPGQMLLLKNVRSWEGELLKGVDHSQSELVKNLAPLFDFYCIDGFSVAHRKQASITGFKRLPCIAGRLMQKELDGLSKATEKIEKPYIMSLGGLKIDDYLGAINEGLRAGRVEAIITGGALSEVLLMARGHDLGEKNRRFLEKQIPLQKVIKRIAELDKKYPNRLIAPKDLSVLDAFGERQEISVPMVPTKWALTQDQVFGIGQKTIDFYLDIVDQAKSIYVKGPPSYYEDKRFFKDTKLLFEKITLRSKEGKLFSFGGGGDTDKALEKTEARLSYQTLAGGAMLWKLEGKILPVEEILERSAENAFSKRTNKKDSSHALKAISAFYASLVMAGVATLSLVFGIAGYFLQDIGVIVTVELFSICAYSIWAHVKYYLLYKEIYYALLNYYHDNPDEEKYSHSDGMPGFKEIKNMEIARNDGYSHPAFTDISEKYQRMIDLHERFKTHLIGMLAILPIISLFVKSPQEVFEKEVRKMWPGREKEEKGTTISVNGELYEIGNWDNAKKAVKTMADVRIALEILKGQIKIQDITNDYPDNQGSRKAIVIKMRSVVELLNNPGRFRKMILETIENRKGIYRANANLFFNEIDGLITALAVLAGTSSFSFVFF
ncbi:MAG: phosphoglycerate kinase [Candidatus Omnitrophota bacterium]